MLETNQLTLPNLSLLVMTRVLLGAGIGVLAATRLNASRRQGIGWTLVAVGALTTIPLALELFGKATTPLAGETRKKS